jgi:hypothetical protein
VRLHWVVMALVRYRVPDGKPFGAIWRCADVDDCKARVDAAGQEWELTDR